MIRQARIGVKVEETAVAVTGLAGMPVLVNLAHTMGLFKDVDTLLPPKERERGWMPMLAFWAELDLVVHDDFRQGAVSPQSDALDFLMDAVEQLPETVTQIYVRSDSAWYQKDVPDHCEDNGYGLAIAADKDEAVRAALTLVNEPDWQRINVPPDTSDEEQYIREWACESVHTMNESEHSYRIIFLHKERRQGDLIRLLPGDLGRVWSREFAFLTDREP